MTMKTLFALALGAVVSALTLSQFSSLAAVSCDRQLIMQIDSATVSIEPDGFSISAFGASESAGWKNPILIVSQQSGDSATIDFVGCRPEVSAQVLTPIQTRALLDLPLGTNRLIIRARTNSTTIEISAP